jgi:hypothetical protein
VRGGDDRLRRAAAVASSVACQILTATDPRPVRRHRSKWIEVFASFFKKKHLFFFAKKEPKNSYPPVISL